MFDQDGADHSRVVGVPEFRDGIGDQVHLPVRVDQGKGRTGNGHEGQIFGRTFGEVFDHVGEKFQLVDQMRKSGRVNLRELYFEYGQFLAYPPRRILGVMRAAPLCTNLAISGMGVV